MACWDAQANMLKGFNYATERTEPMSVKCDIKNEMKLDVHVSNETDCKSGINVSGIAKSSIVKIENQVGEIFDSFIIDYEDDIEQMPTTVDPFSKSIEIQTEHEESVEPVEEDFKKEEPFCIVEVNSEHIESEDIPAGHPETSEQEDFTRMLEETTEVRPENTENECSEIKPTAVQLNNSKSRSQSHRKFDLNYNNESLSTSFGVHSKEKRRTEQSSISVEKCKQASNSKTEKNQSVVLKRTIRKSKKARTRSSKTVLRKYKKGTGRSQKATASLLSSTARKDILGDVSNTSSAVSTRKCFVSLRPLKVEAKDKEMAQPKGDAVKPVLSNMVSTRRRSKSVVPNSPYNDTTDPGNKKSVNTSNDAVEPEQSNMVSTRRRTRSVVPNSRYKDMVDPEKMKSDCDIDDSDADPVYKPASDDDDTDDDKNVTNNITKEDLVSASERDSNDSAIDPQLCTDKSVTILSSKKNTKGNRDNKKHACFFCGKLFPNIARHLTKKHSNEHEVAKILILPIKSKGRRTAWEELVNKGDYFHNSQVIDKGHGTVIPKYRSKKHVEDVRSLIPCQSCRGFYKKNDFWKHQKICNVQKSVDIKLKQVSAEKLFMPHENATKELNDNVIVKMKDDEIKRTVESDNLILRLGNILYHEKGREVNDHIYISVKLRELGRLLLSAKNMDADIKNILDLMKASKWDLLIAAVKNVSEYDEEGRQFGIPSLVRNLGLSLKRCAEIEYSYSTKNGNLENQNLTETFLEMYELKWKKCVGSMANSTLEENRCNKSRFLSLVEDVVKLNNYLEENVIRLCVQIEKSPLEYYADLAKVCLAQITLFNRNRSEDAQRITVKGFLDAKSGGLLDDTTKKSLTVFEQTLCKSHLRIEIMGKEGNKVPVLLTTKMASCLNILLRYREAVGINDKTFLFARPSCTEHPYRGCDVLREFASHCNLKCPDCVMSTSVRRQLTILAQILSLGETDQDILKIFQEHDIRVYEQFNQSSGSALQVAKIFKVLHCLNTGTINKYKGCDFDSIDIEDKEMLANDVETIESESEDELSTENLEEDDESEIDFGESASEDELITDCDIDDSDADPDFKISMSDVDSDDDTGFTGNRPNEDMVSTSESGNIDRAIDPQLCTDNLVTVQSSVKNAKGNLNNKRHACLYCRKLMPNIARHLTNKHSNEHEVAIILMLPLRSKERKSAWQELVNKGDFSHNYQVIDKGHGTLIPKYRSRTNVDDIRSLLPCHSCRGFYKKTDLWKHQKICCVQKPTFLNSKHVRAGKLLMPHKQASKELFENVIVDMNDDEVKRTVESDDFILHHGNILYEEKGHEGYISSKLRELGRLLLSAKNMDADIKSILDLMKASKWDLLIAAIKNVAEYDEESCQFGIPSLVRNLGLSLKRCAEIEYSDATKNRNFKKRNLIETFLETYELKWKKCIGSTANSALEEKKCNKPQLVQLVEDVIKLNKHLEENVKRLCIQVEKNPMEYYADFVKICFAQVILFNRKRSEAAERITVKDILAVKSGGLVDDTIKKSLTLFEQKLSKSHSRVEIKGEKGARMPILLTAKMAFCLNKLLKYRDAAGVDDKTFLFARPGSAEQPYRGCDVLREFASDCNLKHPECITSTKARKQLATLTQILNLGENYQDVLESFKEHDIIVHGQFIQSPESTLHVAKTFKLLNCLNSGTINKYKGCDFDDLDVDLQEILEEDDDERDIESDKSESEDELTTETEPARKKQRVENGKTRRSTSTMDVTNKSASKSAKKRRIFFTEAERQAVEAGFLKEIRLAKVPGKPYVVNFVKQNPAFSKYPWTKIKFAVHNMINARKRKEMDSA